MSETQDKPATLTSRQALIIRTMFFRDCDDLKDAAEWAGFGDYEEVRAAFDALGAIAEGEDR